MDIETRAVGGGAASVMLAPSCTTRIVVLDEDHRPYAGATCRLYSGVQGLVEGGATSAVVDELDRGVFVTPTLAGEALIVSGLFGQREVRARPGGGLHIVRIATEGIKLRFVSALDGVPIRDSRVVVRGGECERASVDHLTIGRTDGAGALWDVPRCSTLQVKAPTGWQVVSAVGASVAGIRRDAADMVSTVRLGEIAGASAAQDAEIVLYCEPVLLVQISAHYFSGRPVSAEGLVWLERQRESDLAFASAWRKVGPSFSVEIVDGLAAVALPPVESDSLVRMALAVQSHELAYGPPVVPSIGLRYSADFVLPPVSPQRSWRLVESLDSGEALTVRARGEGGRFWKSSATANRISLDRDVSPGSLSWELMLDGGDWGIVEVAPNQDSSARPSESELRVHSSAVRIDGDAPVMGSLAMLAGGAVVDLVGLPEGSRIRVPSGKVSFGERAELEMLRDRRELANSGWRVGRGGEVLFGVELSPGEVFSLQDPSPPGFESVVTVVSDAELPPDYQLYVRYGLGRAPNEFAPFSIRQADLVDSEGTIMVNSDAGQRPHWVQVALAAPDARGLFRAAAFPAQEFSARLRVRPAQVTFLAGSGRPTALELYIDDGTGRPLWRIDEPRTGGNPKDQRAWFPPGRYRAYSIGSPGRAVSFEVREGDDLQVTY